MRAGTRVRMRTAEKIVMVDCSTEGEERLRYTTGCCAVISTTQSIGSRIITLQGLISICQRQVGFMP